MQPVVTRIVVEEKISNEEFLRRLEFEAKYLPAKEDESERIYRNFRGRGKISW